MSFVYHRDVLPSGLRVVTVETPHLHTAMVVAYVRVGSRHEPPAVNGVSHFLEHLFFRGSQNYPDTVRMNAAVEEVGGNLNGVTTRDHGSYYTPIHPAHVDVGIRILGDMLTRPLLSHLEVEREIILEEMLDEVDEHGRDIDLDNLSKRALFPGDPLSLKIAGTPDSVRRISREDALKHFARYYVAQNLVFSVAGPVQRADVLEQVAKSFEALPRGAANVDSPVILPKKETRWSFTSHKEAQTEFRLCFRAVPEQHEDYPALSLLRRVLDDGLSSRLPFNVVEKRGLAYSVHAGLESFHDVGIFEVGGASAPEKAADVVTEICSTLAELTSDGPSEEELDRAKRRQRMFLDFSQDSPSDLAGWFGGTELFRLPESFDALAQASDAQTTETVKQAARRYLNLSNLTAVAVGQKKGAQKLESAVRNAPLHKGATFAGQRAEASSKTGSRSRGTK